MSVSWRTAYPCRAVEVSVVRESARDVMASEETSHVAALAIRGTRCGLRSGVIICFATAGICPLCDLPPGVRSMQQPVDLLRAHDHPAPKPRGTRGLSRLLQLRWWLPKELAEQEYFHWHVRFTSAKRAWIRPAPGRCSRGTSKQMLAALLRAVRCPQ